MKSKIILEYSGYVLTFTKDRKGVVHCKAVDVYGDTYRITTQQDTQTKITWSNFAEAIYDVVRTLKGQ